MQIIGHCIADHSEILMTVCPHQRTRIGFPVHPQTVFSLKLNAPYTYFFPIAVYRLACLGIFDFDIYLIQRRGRRIPQPGILDLDASMAIAVFSGRDLNGTYLFTDRLPGRRAQCNMNFSFERLPGLVFQLYFQLQIR